MVRLLSMYKHRYNGCCSLGFLMTLKLMRQTAWTVPVRPHHIMRGKTRKTRTCWVTWTPCGMIRAIWWLRPRPFVRAWSACFFQYLLCATHPTQRRGCRSAVRWRIRMWPSSIGIRTWTTRPISWSPVSGKCASILQQRIASFKPRYGC